MKSSYITYFAGYDKDGYEVFNGNGQATVENDGFVDPEEFRVAHTGAMLKVAKDINKSVCRIVIKSIMKL